MIGWLAVNDELASLLMLSIIDLFCDWISSMDVLTFSSTVYAAFPIRDED